MPDRFDRLERLNRPSQTSQPQNTRDGWFQRSVVPPPAPTTPTASPAVPPAWDPLAQQIAQQWQQYGINADIQGINRAQELAEILHGRGVTDLGGLSYVDKRVTTKPGGRWNAVSLGEGMEGSEWVSDPNYTETTGGGLLSFGGKELGYSGTYGNDNRIAQEYGDYLQAKGDRELLAGSARGKGWVDYTVQRDAAGNPVIVPVWGNTSDKGDLLKLAQIGMMFIPGGQFAALGSGITGGALTGLAAQALGTGLATGTLSKLAGGDFLKGAVAGGLGTLATPMIGSATSGITDALNLSGTAGNIASSGISGALRGGLTAGLTGGSVGEGILAGGIGGATSAGVGAAVNSALDTAGAGEAVSKIAAPVLTSALLGGDPKTALLRAGLGYLGNQITNGAGVAPAVERAYQDPSRQMDTPTNEQLYREQWGNEALLGDYGVNPLVEQAYRDPSRRLDAPTNEQDYRDIWGSFGVSPEVERAYRDPSRQLDTPTNEQAYRDVWAGTAPSGVAKPGAGGGKTTAPKSLSGGSPSGAQSGGMDMAAIMAMMGAMAASRPRESDGITRTASARVESPFGLMYGMEG